jgi:thiol-disulfide isomerase/thioredoxin
MLRLFLLISLSFIFSEDSFEDKLNHKIKIECPGNIGCDCETANDCINNNCIRIPKGGFCMPALGDEFPDFYSLNQFEELISLRDIETKGKYVMIEMGTTWCAPCNVLASWLTWDDNEIENRRWWKPEYTKIKTLINENKVILITVLYEDEHRDNANYKTVFEWYDNFPDKHTIILSDNNKELHKWLKPTGIPAITLLDSNMNVIVYTNRGLNIAFDKLLELTDEN